MAFPEPAPGLVIRYSYLWRREHDGGQEEGTKDRPCAVILVTADAGGNKVVTVLPITHTPPGGDFAVEISQLTKQRLGLDAERSWVVLTEANRFTWPGPDLRMKSPLDGTESVVYGLLPRAVFKEIAGKFGDAVEAHLAQVVLRTQ